MVVGGGADNGKAQGITFVDKACTRIHKGLLARVITPEEKEALMFCMQEKAVNEIEGECDDNYMADATVSRIHVANINTYKKSQSQTTDPGCQYSNVGMCIDEFQRRGQIVNGSNVVNIGSTHVLVTSSFFNLCYSKDNYEANSIHQGFSNIGKVLGIDPKKGKFLITEPNKPEELTPGVVQCTEHTISHRVKTSDRTIENGRYIEKSSR